jgi:thioredoxin reductase
MVGMERTILPAIAESEFLLAERTAVHRRKAIMSPTDAVLIGGGPAGLQAALLLGRGGTRTVVYDSGTARHLVSAAAHGFLGADGMAPAELRRRGRDQLEPYRTVDFRDAVVHTIERLPDGCFRVVAEDQPALTTRYLVLATGMQDVPLDIPGYEDCRGKSVLNCPYCHGWEFRDEALGVLVQDLDNLNLALTVTWWSRDVVLFLSPELSLSADVSEKLSGLDATIELRRVRRLVGSAESGQLEAVELEDGTLVPRRAVYHRPKQLQAPLVEAVRSSLGLRFTDDGCVVVDEEMQTNVPGLYAAGDLTTKIQQIAEAAQQGHRAALSIERALKSGGRRRSPNREDTEAPGRSG